MVRRLWVSLIVWIGSIRGQQPNIFRYEGMRDASAAVALNDKTFVVANDEDNVLRIFQIGKAAAIGTIYLSRLFPEISDAKNQEIDLEGATALGDKIFWIGSHCANKSAEIAPSRNRLIAIEIIKNAEGEYTPKASGTSSPN